VVPFPELPFASFVCTPPDLCLYPHMPSPPGFASAPVGRLQGASSLHSWYTAATDRLAGSALKTLIPANLELFRKSNDLLHNRA
jgi:hypothetical protein